MIHAVLATAALAYVAGFVWTALARIGHPFELEWMGGAFVDHVCRVLDGQSIYVAPSADFVPFLYTPLYMYASAAVARVIGEGFLPLRIVSLTAALATLGLIAWYVRWRTGRWLPGIVAAGAYAACYPLVDTWYDTARVDSMFVLLTMVTIALATLPATATPSRGRWTAVAAGAVLVAAYLTKQTALLLAPPLAIAILVRDGRHRALWFGATFAVLWFASTTALDAATDGWFHFYTWTMPQAHQYALAPLALFLGSDLAWVAPMLLLAAWLEFDRARSRGELRVLLGDGAWGLGCLLAAMSSRMHVGGAINVVMPAYLALAVLTGLAFARAHGASVRTRRVVTALVALQLALCVYDPRRWLPTDADRAVGERLVAMLRAADGPVLVPFHGYLPRMAGKAGGAHVMALIDIERGGDRRLWERLEAEFVESARSRRAALVVLDEDISDPGERLLRLVHPGYLPVERLVPVEDGETFMPVVGLQTRPVTVLKRVE